MWFASLQNFSSRWGPYSNKMLWSWEALGRWCPDALDWCCLLDDEFQLDSGTFLFLCNWHEKKEKKKSKAKHCMFLLPTSHSSLSYCIPFLLSRKLQFSLQLGTLALLQWLQTGHQLWARTGRKEANFGVGWGHNRASAFCCHAADWAFHSRKCTFPGSAGLAWNPDPVCSR